MPPDAPQQTFLNVANDFFRDGVISWGRIVALFYFGYKMACKVNWAIFSTIYAVYLPLVLGHFIFAVLVLKFEIVHSSTC